MEDAFQSRALPTQVYVVLTPQSAYRGSQTSTPFYFGTYHLTCIKFTIDSDVYELKCDFDSTDAADWTAAFHSLYRNNIKYNHQMKITYDDFANKGFALFSFDLGGETNMSHDSVGLKRLGIARLTLEFDSASTNESLVALMYCESPQLITIDSNRKVEKDYFV